MAKKNKNKLKSKNKVFCTLEAMILILLSSIISFLNLFNVSSKSKSKINAEIETSQIQSYDDYKLLEEQIIGEVKELIKKMESKNKKETHENNKDNIIKNKKPNIFIDEELYREPLENTSEPLSEEELKQIENEEKVNIILIKYGITKEQFDVIVACVLMEALDKSYTDAYAVVSTMYNKIITQKYIDYCNRFMGEGTGENIYYQCIFPNAYVVYQNGMYKRVYQMEGIEKEPGYQAVVDCLYSEMPMHNYVGFQAGAIGEQFVEGGNIYHIDILEEEVLPLEERITTRNLKEYNAKKLNRTR